MNDKHYMSFKKYVTKKRWLSYWHQINEVLEINPETVLVIGIGNGIIPEILREKNIKVYTFDNDPEMKPDFCGDIRNIKAILKDLKVDTILCCQVLEHIEFKYFQSIIKDMKKIAKNRIIISLPHAHIAFSGWICLPIIHSIEWYIALPLFWIKNCFYDKEHHWEVGMRHYSKKRIEKILKEEFKIQKKYHIKIYPYHLFYILEKKNV
jgi:2-polyprenyl-3-methyl-5-hydroxy-6-metoxy-1,4-benzoquinol methylase